MISTTTSYMCTCVCGSEWVTSSKMDLALYSLFGASRGFPILMTMSIRRFLSAVNGSPLSTWCGFPSRFNVRETAWRSGWCWFTCAADLGQMRAYRMSMSTASQQGHLTATCSSTPNKRLPTVSYTHLTLPTIYSV